jgi:hypothetical protein
VTGQDIADCFKCSAMNPDDPCTRHAAGRLPHRRFPCAECPVRKDNAGNPRSKFPASRWEALRATSGDAGPGAPLFGCHEGEPGTGADLLCAGWAASFGRESAEVRIAVMCGLLPVEALDPGVNWPELYQDWDEMVAAQTLQPGEPDDHLPPELRKGRRR